MGAGGAGSTYSYAGVRASRATGSVKPKEFKFSFEDAAAARSSPPKPTRPVSAGPIRAQVNPPPASKKITLDDQATRFDRQRISPARRGAVDRAIGA